MRIILLAIFLTACTTEHEHVAGCAHDRPHSKKVNMRALHVKLPKDDEYRSAAGIRENLTNSGYKWRQ